MKIRQAIEPCIIAAIDAGRHFKKLLWLMSAAASHAAARANQKRGDRLCSEHSCSIASSESSSKRPIVSQSQLLTVAHMPTARAANSLAALGGHCSSSAGSITCFQKPTLLLFRRACQGGANGTRVSGRKYGFLGAATNRGRPLVDDCSFPKVTGACKTEGRYECEKVALDTRETLFIGK